ncbi:glycosyltransferase [Mesorhizobium sp. PL10]
MSTDVKKYVAIRFNTATGFKPSQWDGKGRANLDPVWLVERLALFDTYCAPSLEAQSLKDFTVLVAFDAETHENYVRTVCACVAGVDVRPVLVEAGENLNARFNEVVLGDSDAEFVSVTRLDSDDALAPGFMERVEHYARREIAKGEVDLQPLFIAFPVGQNFDVASHRYTHHDYTTSAFGTLVEKRSPEMSGIYSDHHAKMATRFNTVVAASKEAQWCIVIHDNNAANVLRGKPIAEAYFSVGRPGVETKKLQPARKDSPPLQMLRNGKAPRTAGNFIRFLLGRPMLLRG